MKARFLNRYNSIYIYVTIEGKKCKYSTGIKCDEKNFENFYFSLYDITGKQVEKQSINAKITTISLDKQAASTYFLSVYSDSNTLLKSYKIIKK
jgi:hypothetical protein